MIACQIMKKERVFRYNKVLYADCKLLFFCNFFLRDKFILTFFFVFLLGGEYKYISPIHSFVNSKFQFFLISMIFLINFVVLNHDSLCM